ncbi:MAG: hypothetical protein RIQ93_1301 [Verrucomicrobiota bacterium]|jgi:ArsR family transcriptional regulator
MDLAVIYACFSDRTRLRILNLLGQGPLCVCHVQDVLGESQVKISKHLGYFKTRGLVGVTREANWRIYRLVGKPSKALAANLACLRSCAADDKIFRRDSERLRARRRGFDANAPKCCALPRAAKTKAR